MSNGRGRFFQWFSRFADSVHNLKVHLDFNDTKIIGKIRPPIEVNLLRSDGARGTFPLFAAVDLYFKIFLIVKIVNSI